MKDAARQVGMGEVERRFLLLDMESKKELEKRLEARKSPDIIFIDSLQYFRLTMNDYERYKKEISQ